MSSYSLGVFVCSGGRFATWKNEESGAQGSVLMRESETLHECFSRAMDEKRAQAAQLLRDADRLKGFSIQAYSERQANLSAKARK